MESTKTRWTELFSSIADCGKRIEALPFKRTQIMSKAVLESNDFDDEWEGVRDATEQEIALFAEREKVNEHIEVDDENWTANISKSLKPAGLKYQIDPNGDPFQQAYDLIDLQYPRPSTEKIDELRDEYDELQASIANLEKSLKLPLAKGPVDAEQEKIDKEASRLNGIMKREELEILALSEILPLRQAEVDDLRAQVRRARMRAVAPPAQNPAPIPTPSLAGFSRSSRTPMNSAPATPPSEVTPVLLNTPSPINDAEIEEEEIITPKAPVAPVFKEVKRVAKKVVRQVKELPDGITTEDVQSIVNLLWNSHLGEIFRSHTLDDGEDLPSPIPLALTLEAIHAIMESPTVDPSDTSSSVAPSISSNGSPIQPTQMIVAQMKWLSLILLTFSNPPTPTSFPVILRKNKLVIDQLKPRFYISLNLLKPEISKFLEGKEFENAAGLGTSALYELVAQFIVELNREGTAAVTFVIPN